MNLSLKFPSRQNEFFITLSQRVNQYFKSNEIEKTGNSEMIFKTVFMFSLYLIPYFVLISGATANGWGIIGLYAIMGLGTAGIGLSIMHDANHGAYSSKAWVNNWLGLTLNLVGGHAMNWKIQHNVLHHTYTNVHEVDEDISPRGILRMAPESEWRPMHRYQQYYAWFFYGLLTLAWIVAKDFMRLARYQREGMLKKQRAKASSEWASLIFTKIFYAGYIIVLPYYLLPVAFWQILLGFVVMHYIAGFILSIIFQPAHVIEGTEFPMPDETGNMENNWAIHQLHTTTNFGHKHKLFSWYIGGLNYQVEHHLFPNICHVHYKKIAKIVEQTAKEFDLPYKSKDTFIQALAAHTRLLRTLGQRPLTVVS